MAARATFALKAGVWFRRGRLLMVAPDSQAQRARCQAEIPLIALCRFPEPALTYGHGKQQKRLLQRYAAHARSLPLRSADGDEGGDFQSWASFNNRRLVVTLQ